MSSVCFGSSGWPIPCELGGKLLTKSAILLDISAAASSCARWSKGDAMWINTSRERFQGVIIMVPEKSKGVSLGYVNLKHWTLFHHSFVSFHYCRLTTGKQIETNNTNRFTQHDFIFPWCFHIYEKNCLFPCFAYAYVPILSFNSIGLFIGSWSLMIFTWYFLHNWSFLSMCGACVEAVV